VKVVLSGDGGDELFAGYDRFSGQRLAGLLAFIPQGLRRTVVRRLIGMVPETFAYKSMAQKLRWVNEMSLLQDGERYAQSMSFLRYTEEAKAGLFTEDALRSLGGINSHDKILEHFGAPNAEHVVDRMLYTDLMTRMPEHLLSMVDRMSMAHSLEVRPPLMEHRMVEFAASVPAGLKLKGTKLKYILRQVASRHVDESLITRRKQGFAFPIGHWIRGDLRELVENALETSRFVEQGTFNHDYVAAMLDEHVRGARDHSFRVWIFLNLELWYRMFVEEQSHGAIEEWIDRWAPQTSPAAA
jgi:asparagine synthase (glutamine-hydrolysing)